jgi:hypothetical protein
MRRQVSRFVVISALTGFAVAGAAVPGAMGPAAAATPAATSAGGSDVTVSKTITRTQTDATGAELPAGTPGVESRSVTMTVSQTQNLRSRQSVDVTWKGAHPTGNVQGDPNSPLATNDEFPFVLLQCRGSDSTSVPVSEQLSPQTCWTQTGPQERMSQTPSTAFPAWRVDRYAAPDERTLHVNDPSPLPAGCDPYTGYATRRVPFVNVTGTTYYPDFASCTKQPPEALVVDNASQPGNTTYGITRPDGNGDAKFTMWSAQDNSSLGCSDIVKCSLVAVPVLGISCDVAATSLPAADRPPATKTAAVTKDCMSTGVFLPGQPSNSGGSPPALSVSGRLWWAASNWRNRITVPLTFAPADNICDLVSAKEPIDLYGSELMTQAMIQWRPAFCLDPKRTPFRHVQVGEPQAASLLDQSSIEAGLVSYPPQGGYTRPVVNAPVALSGFAISYAIDDAEGGSYKKLRMTPRLIAKLLTMSYPGAQWVQDEYAALHTNPLEMSLDPEFQALNPGITKGVANNISASTILSLSSDSDVLRSLTAYLNSDKETRAWLDGAPDPWGMKVNPSYAKIALPVQTWPQLDTFEPAKYYASGLNFCLKSSPAPYLPLIASPTIRMSNITFAMQFANATSQVDCIQPILGSTEGLKLAAGGRENPGFRFVLGLTSLADSARYALDTAALQTTVAAGTAAKFTNDTGRTFVSPTDAGLRSAGQLLTPNVKAGLWDLPIARIVTQDAAKAAYPGAMVVYAAVPTLGLPATDAQAYSALLRWAATTGQTPGTTNGTLPPGYLPLTAANGLQSLASYTALAATAVAEQKGAVPSILGSSAAAPTGGTTALGGTPGSGLFLGGPGGSGGLGLPIAPGASGAAGASPGGAAAAPAPGSAKSKAAAKAGPKPVALGPQRVATVSQDIGLAGTMARILFLVALVLGGAIPLTFGVRRLRSPRE